MRALLYWCVFPALLCSTCFTISKKAFKWLADIPGISSGDADRRDAISLIEQCLLGPFGSDLYPLLH